jgi:hypothetical protein
MIVLKEYYTEVNKSFVFQCFSNVFKEGFCKVKEGSLGLAKKGEVDEKKEVVSKSTSKKACKL